MKFITIIAFLVIGLTTSGLALAKVGFGELYYDGDVVRTVVPPAAAPMMGRDNIYPIMGGVEGQRPVAAVGPGDRDYHGGQWAVYVAMWTVGIEPYLLTSEEEVLDAYMAGYISITRMMDADFKCPIQKLPGGN